MDKIDMLLIKALWQDSRISFNQLGKNLEISGNILKKRAERLQEEGVFIYHTNPVFSQFRYGQVVFSLKIPKITRKEYIKKISDSFAEIYEIIFSLKEECAIVVLLPFDSKEGVTIETINLFKGNFYKKIKIKLSDPYKLEYVFNENPQSLKPMELRLLRLLRQNSRRDLINLSEKLNLSKKTLSRYLQKFSKNFLIKHTVGLQPSKIRNFIIHLLFIKFGKIEDLTKIVEKIKENVNWISFFTLIDPPGCGLWVYSETINELEEKMEFLYKTDEISEINIFFPSSIERFENWKKLVIPDQIEAKK